MWSSILDEIKLSQFMLYGAELGMCHLFGNAPNANGVASVQSKSLARSAEAQKDLVRVTASMPF